MEGCCSADTARAMSCWSCETHWRGRLTTLKDHCIRMQRMRFGRIRSHCCFDFNTRYYCCYNDAMRCDFALPHELLAGDQTLCVSDRLCHVLSALSLAWYEVRRFDSERSGRPVWSGEHRCWTAQSRGASLVNLRRAQEWAR